VEVQLPKFRVESTYAELIPVLRGLGLRAMFDPSRANFTGVAVAPDGSERPIGKLFVNRVIQKALIEVHFIKLHSTVRNCWMHSLLGK
jgi:serine protease inhibitor